MTKKWSLKSAAWQEEAVYVLYYQKGTYSPPRQPPPASSCAPPPPPPAQRAHAPALPHGRLSPALVRSAALFWTRAPLRALRPFSASLLEAPPAPFGQPRQRPRLLRSLRRGLELRAWQWIRRRPQGCGFLPEEGDRNKMGTSCSFRTASETASVFRTFLRLESCDGLLGGFRSADCSLRMEIETRLRRAASAPFGRL